MPFRQKNKNIKVLPLNKITQYIEEFVNFTKAHPHMQFFVTRIGCGLAGYKDSQIAPLFKNAINCSFAEEWRPYIENNFE